MKIVLAAVTIPLFLAIPFYYAASSIGQATPRHDIAWHLDNLPELRPSVEKAVIEGKREFSLPSGHAVTLTIDPGLQREVMQTLADHKPDVGAFMAVEPKTGRVLAISGYRQGSGEVIDPVLTSDYPAASLIKIVTASAAIETLDFTPGTQIGYRTGVLSLTARDLSAPEGGRGPSMTLTDAMACSANSVFGKVTASYLGQETFRRYLDNYGFDHPIPFDLGEVTSSADIPGEGLDLAMAGAGLGKISLSPVHAAVLGASVANGGVMMRPYLVDSIRDAGGELVYDAELMPIAQPVSPDTAAEIVAMMKETPLTGTLRRTFPGGKWAEFAKRHEIAGKTGTLSWGSPRLRYRWILGIAPADDPAICVAALTGSRSRSVSKSSYLAREALAEFFAFEEGLIPEPAVKAKKTVRASKPKAKARR